MTQTVKNLLASARDARDSSLIPGQEDPAEQEMATPPVFLPGKFHGQRTLAGYSPWGCKELDTTEQLTLSLFQGKGERWEMGGQWSTQNIDSVC